MKRILITGGIGFIGAPLVERLLAENNIVRVYDNGFRNDTHRLDAVKADVEIINGDIRNPDALKDACRGVSTVIHLAAINGTANFYNMPYEVMDSAINGMFNLIEACTFRGTETLLLASSSEVYQTPLVIPTDETAAYSIPDPFNPRYSYALGKQVSEMLAIHCKAFPRLLIVRPHNIYGPDMGYGHIIPQLAVAIKDGTVKFSYANAPPKVTNSNNVFWGGKQTRAFCYIDDCIEGLMTVLNKGETNNIYNIGNPEEITIVELAERIAKLAGASLVIEGEKTDDGGTFRRCPDISKLKKLGYLPKVKLDAGLKSTLDWYWKDVK